MIDLDFPMTDNAAAAVAATAGAADANIVDPDIPDVFAAITARFAEILRFADSALPRPLLFHDRTFIGAFVLILVAHSLDNIVPYPPWAAQAWMFSKLLLVLVVVYGAFCLICSLWNKILNSANRSPTASLITDISRQESKSELVRRWIRNLPTDEHQANVILKQFEDDSTFIDPLGDGQTLDDVKEVNAISEVLAHHLSVSFGTGTETSENDAERLLECLKNLSNFSSSLQATDCSQFLSDDVIRKPSDRRTPVTESVLPVCSGGDVAWSTGENGSSEKLKEPYLMVEQSDENIVLSPKDIVNFIKSDSASPYTKLNHVTLSQDGLNFSDTSDDTESITPEEDASLCKESEDIIQVCSNDILAEHLNPSLEKNEHFHESELGLYEEAIGQTCAQNMKTASTMTEDCIPDENLFSVRPPSQPAGASSAYSVSEAFLLRRNALSDEEYELLDNLDVDVTDPYPQSNVECRTCHLQIPVHGGCCNPTGYGHHRYGYHLPCSADCECEDKGIGACTAACEGFCEDDSFLDNRMTPQACLGFPCRSPCDPSEHSKFQLSSIPEDDLPQSV